MLKHKFNLNPKLRGNFWWYENKNGIDIYYQEPVNQLGGRPKPDHFLISKKTIIRLGKIYLQRDVVNRELGKQC